MQPVPAHDRTIPAPGTVPDRCSHARPGADGVPHGYLGGHSCALSRAAWNGFPGPVGDASGTPSPNASERISVRFGARNSLLSWLSDGAFPDGSGRGVRRISRFRAGAHGGGIASRPGAGAGVRGMFESGGQPHPHLTRSRHIPVIPFAGRRAENSLSCPTPRPGRGCRGTAPAADSSYCPRGLGRALLLLRLGGRDRSQPPRMRTASGAGERVHAIGLADAMTLRSSRPRVKRCVASPCSGSAAPVGRQADPGTAPPRRWRGSDPPAVLRQKAGGPCGAGSVAEGGAGRRRGKSPSTGCDRGFSLGPSSASLTSQPDATTPVKPRRWVRMIMIESQSLQPRRRRGATGSTRGRVA